MDEREDETDLGVVLGVAGVERDRLEVELALEVDGRDDVPFARREEQSVSTTGSTAGTRGRCSSPSSSSSSPGPDCTAPRLASRGREVG